MIALFISGYKWFHKQTSDLQSRDGFDEALADPLVQRSLNESRRSILVELERNAPSLLEKYSNTPEGLQSEKNNLAPAIQTLSSSLHESMQQIVDSLSHFNATLQRLDDLSHQAELPNSKNTENLPGKE